MSERLSGTVTFMFTDIEGSTGLLKQLGRDRYGELLSDQQVLLRNVFAEHRGEEVDTQGDSFFVAFRSAADAVAAAIAIQRSLADRDWPDAVEPRVRIGIHSGEAAATGERYVGFSVHRAARIGAVAHGGQVLLSDATRVLVEDDLPPGVYLRDLGLYRLKDVDRPERISQLATEGLPIAFPPLRGAERVKAAPLLRRRSTLAAALVGVVAAAVAIPVFSIGSGGSGVPFNAASIGADGVGAIDASSGRPLGSGPVGSAPGALAIGEGSVWATLPEAQSVARIDPKTNTRAGTVGVGSNPTGVAVGGGFVWVTNGFESSVSKIDPNGNGGSGAVVDTIPVGNGPTGVAFGADRLWVANSTDRTVMEFVPGSHRPLRTIGVTGGADGIAYGSGFVWVVSGAGNTVTRIDPRSGTVLPPIGVGNNPTAISVGAGAAWVANGLDGTASRIDPSTGATNVVSVGGNPAGIAAVEGAVWVSDQRTGVLSRIDPAADRVVQTLKSKNPPGGLAAGEGTVYVSVGTPAAAHRGGTLTVFSIDVPDSIDPATAYNSLSWSALSMTNDGLVTFQRVGGSDGARIVPDLATSLPTVSDGGTTYTFQVRPGIHYSTGAVVQPADFRHAIERALGYQAAKQHPGAGYYLAGIVGAAVCMKNPDRCDLRKGIATDPTARTVIFHLSAPDPDFLMKLALSPAYAVPSTTPFKTRLPVPATGPYVIASSTQHALTLVRNARFQEWSAAAQPAGFPDKIVYRFGVSAGRQVTAVKKGAADYTTVTTAAIAPLQRDGFGSQLHTNQLFATDFFFLATRLSPFDNVDVRRALNYAVDRNRLAQLVSGIYGQPTQPTCQVLPPNTLGYARYCLYPHDLAKARRLVAASGTAGQRVTVWVGPPGTAIGTYLVSVLQSLGYRARLSVLSPADTYYAKVLGGPRQYQTGPAGWFADYPSPSQFLTALLTCASAHAPLNAGVNWNISAFCERSVDREIDRARELQISDPQAAAVLWSTIDRDVMEQAPWVPTATRAQIDFVSRRTGNYQYNPQWGPLFDQMWVR